MRVLGTSIAKAEEARREVAIVLVRKGVKYPIALPDISTKEKAQKFIGLDMAKLEKDKENLIKNVLPKWDAAAKERQGELKKY
jgi:nitrite reductase (cytochrome c-552)